MTALNFITVKIGKPYTSEDVNRVYQMVQRTTQHPFKFFCYTDDGAGLNPNITVIDYIDHGFDLIVANKLFLLSKGFGGITGRCVYFDVDIILKENMDPFITSDLNGTLRTVFTFWKEKDPQWLRGEDPMLDYFFSKCYHRLNSSIMVWDADSTEVHNIWDEYYANPEYFMVKYPFGMDAYLANEQMRRLSFFPRGIVCSHLYGRYEDAAREDWRDTDVTFILLNGSHNTNTYALYTRYFI